MKLLAISLFSLTSVSVFAASESRTEVVVYSSRAEQLIQPLIDSYEKTHPVDIKLVTGEPGALLERIKAEGEKTPADILMTVDAGNLWHATREGVLASVKSDTLSKRVPANLRDPQNRWFGLSLRARTIFYNPSKLTAEQIANLKGYESLANPEFKGKVCLRTSKKVYNQSLVASLIAHHGEKEAERIVKGWVNNLGAAVFPNDTAMLEAVHAEGNACAIGVANTYYFGRMFDKKKDWNVKVLWPNQSTYGTHVNVSGAGVLKNSDQKEAAVKFLEWLTEKEAQRMFADLNMEYPIEDNVPVNKTVNQWGSFKQDALELSRVGELQQAAVRLMDRAKYQ